MNNTQNPSIELQILILATASDVSVLNSLNPPPRPRPALLAINVCIYEIPKNKMERDPER